MIYAENIGNETSVNNTENNVNDSNSNNNDENEIKHNQSTNTSNNSSNTQNTVKTSTSSGSASTVHGSMWVKASDMGNINFAQIKTGGIQDIFLHQLALSDSKFKANLTAFLNNAKNAGIRVSAWVLCLKSNGKFIDPTGRYTYSVSTSYKTKVKKAYKYWYKVKVKVAYKKSVKKYYKSYYYSHGKLKYKLKYKLVKKTYYKYVYKSTYKIKYKTVYQTKYKKTTKLGYNKAYAYSYMNNLTKRIVSYAKINGINGIHLDYIRYSGKAYASPGGTTTITNLVAKITKAVKTVKPNALLSAALMPETNANAYYYGQDYTQLGNYLDVLIPMVYKGNYNKDAAWIGKTSKYISSHSNGKPVWIGLTTYKSDAKPTPLSATELLNDVKAALNNGAAGYALFRYGNVLNNNFFNYSGSLGC